VGYGQHAHYLQQHAPLFEKRSSPNEPLIEEHLDGLKQRGFRLETLRTHSRILRRLDRSTDIFAPTAVAKYINDLQVSDGTRENLHQTYSTWCQTRQLTYIMPKSHYRSPIPRAPTEEEIDLLISSATKKYATVLTLLKETGMRVSELHNLTKDDFDLQRRLVYVKTIKDGNPRTLQISERLTTLLSDYFVKSTRFTNPKHLRSHFSNIRNRAITNTGQQELMRVKLHSFRHFFATSLYYRTRDILLVKKRLGHRSIESTLVYTHVIEELPPLSFHVATASNVSDATKLIESGFDYVTEIEGVKLFRKLK